MSNNKHRITVFRRGIGKRTKKVIVSKGNSRVAPHSIAKNTVCKENVKGKHKYLFFYNNRGERCCRCLNCGKYSKIDIESKTNVKFRKIAQNTLKKRQTLFDRSQFNL